MLQCCVNFFCFVYEGLNSTLFVYACAVFFFLRGNIPSFCAILLQFPAATCCGFEFDCLLSWT